MHDLELEKVVAIAKSAPASMSKSEWYATMKTFSNRRRERGESEQSAFAKFIVDADGREMYAAYKSASGASYAPQRPIQKEMSFASAPLIGLRKIAANLQSANPSLTPAQAMSQAVLTPEGARLYLEDRYARLGH